VQDVDRLFPGNSNADVKSDVPKVRCSSLLAMFLMRILLRPVAHFALLLLESRSVIIRIARVLFPEQKRERKDEKVPAKCRRDRIALFQPISRSINVASSLVDSSLRLHRVELDKSSGTFARHLLFMYLTLP